ncbi:MAG: hypothetical protein R3C32_12970 [Chloroflexota bacterium]
MTVVFISHKLAEVRAVNDGVTVLRAGRIVGTVAGSTDERELAAMMVGRPAFGVAGLRGLTARRARGRGSLGPGASGSTGAPRRRTRSGRAGSSAWQASRATARPNWSRCSSGCAAPDGGSVRVGDVELAGASPATVMAAGVGRITRTGMQALVLDLSVARQHGPRASGRLRPGRTAGPVRHPTSPRGLIERFAIRAGPDDQVRTLSRSNIQSPAGSRPVARPAAGGGVPADARPGRRCDGVRAVGAALPTRRRGLTVCSCPRTSTSCWPCPDPDHPVLYEGAVTWPELAAGAADPERAEDAHGGSRTAGRLVVRSALVGGGRGDLLRAVVVATLVTVRVLSGLFLLAGANPVAAWAVTSSCPLASSFTALEVLVSATPILLTGAAVAIAFHGGLLEHRRGGPAAGRDHRGGRGRPRRHRPAARPGRTGGAARGRPRRGAVEPLARR